MRAGRHLLPWIELLLILWPLFLPAAEPPAAKAAATNSPAQSSAFKLVTATETVADVASVIRASFTAGTNKFTFIVPDGFGLQSENSRNKFTMFAGDKIGIITVQVTVAAGDQTAEFKSENLRQKVLTRYQAPKIVDEFTASAGNLSGPAFEVEWVHGGSQTTLAARAVFIPFPGGLLEFDQIAPKSKIRAYDQALNQVLLSFRHAPINGKFDIAPLSSKF